REHGIVGITEQVEGKCRTNREFDRRKRNIAEIAKRRERCVPSDRQVCFIAVLRNIRSSHVQQNVQLQHQHDHRN
ncbi:hypothetical protein PFISCL1PPCAC_20346, partial [Pristionchus fissidentatus]